MRLLATDVCIDRGGRRILSNVSFALDTGGALVITGPNGVGKSSLLRVLAGFLRPSAGQVEIEGAAATQPLHYLGHRDGLKPSLTAAENLRFAAGFLGLGAVAGGPSAALASFGLAHAADVPVMWLSAGQKRRVALARLLVAPRSLWLLDEPTAGLDASSVDSFEALAGSHLAAGGLIVATTHAPLRLGARELRLSVGGGAG